MTAARIAVALVLGLLTALAPAYALAQDVPTDDPPPDMVDEEQEPPPPPPTFTPPKAGGPRRLTPGGGPLPDPWQVWANDSLMPTPPIRIVVWTTSCDEYGASCIDWPNGQTVIKVGAETDVVAQYEFLHELGHAFDWWYLDRRSRARFKRLIKLDRGWWKGASPPGERFAMAYSLCAMSDAVPTSDLYPGYDYAPSTATHRAACAFIRESARCGAGRRARTSRVTARCARAARRQ